MTSGVNKTCSKCKDTYPATTEFFHARKDSKDGLFGACKACILGGQKIYRATKRGKEVARRAGKKYAVSTHGQVTRKRYRSSINRILRDAYRNMLDRCTKPQHQAWKNYGGRGIKVLFKSADEFVDHVINKLQVNPRGLTVDRIDNDGNYEPGNIRFITKSENNKNRRS